MAIISVSGLIGSGKDTVGKIIQYLDWCNNVNSSDLPCFEDWIDSTENPIVGHHIKWHIKKFGYKLKQMCCILTGTTMEQWEDQKFKESAMPDEWQSPSRFSNIFTYRDFIQKLGTEAVRNNVHTNAWVNALFADYKPIGVSTSYSREEIGELGSLKSDKHLPKVFETNYPNWIITDTRFPNEFDACKERGGLMLKVVRPHILIEEGKLVAGAPISFTPHLSETALDNHEFDYIIDNSGTLEDLVEQVRTILTERKILS